MKTALILILTIFLVNIGLGATRTSVGDGLWNDIGTWDTGIPQAGDDVIIRGGDAVTLNVNSAILQSVEIQAGGILRPPAAIVSYDLNLTGDLTVAGDFQGFRVGGTITLIFQGTSILSVTGAGSFEPNRLDVNVGNTLTLASSLSSTNGLPTTTDFNINGTLACGTNTINFPNVLGTFDLAGGATLDTDVAG